LDREVQDSKLPRRMLTIKEVASILNIHPNKVRRWEKKGLLKSYIIGPHRNIRFNQEDIFELLDKSKSGGGIRSVAE